MVDVAEVSGDGDGAVSFTDEVAYGVDSVMRKAEGVDGEAAAGEVLAAFENGPARGGFHGFSDDAGGLDGGVDGCVAGSQEDVEAADVVAVFVGKEDTGEFFWGDSEEFESDAELFGAETGVDEEGFALTFYDD